jgi:ribosomal protein S24E
MTRALMICAAFLILVPAALAVPPADKGKPESPGKSAAAPGQSAEQNAAKACKAERTKLGVQAFKDKYGTNANKANAFGKCVSATAKKLEAAEEAQQATENAAKACKAERTKLGVQAFKDKYGTNANKANAFGKCVSATAKKLEAAEEAQQATENAAKACKAERTKLGVQAFKDKYGTNANKANAFGKCVSTLAKKKTTS